MIIIITGASGGGGLLFAYLVLVTVLNELFPWLYVVLPWIIVGVIILFGLACALLSKGAFLIGITAYLLIFILIMSAAFYFLLNGFLFLLAGLAALVLNFYVCAFMTALIYEKLEEIYNKARSKKITALSISLFTCGVSLALFVLSVYAANNLLIF